MISNKLLQLRSKSLSKKGMDRKPIPYQDAKEIGILYTTESKDKHNTVKNIIQTFESEGKNTNVLTFVPNDKENIEFKFDYFTKKDINFTGRFKSESVQNFLAKHYDFLILLDFTPSNITTALLSMSKAKCRVGIVNEDNLAHLELMFEGKNQDYKLYKEDIFKYIKII